MTEDWLSRWEQGRTGWHEASGNAALRHYWPELPAGSRVLVPLCGKSLDLVWLENRGLEVIGVELSQLAVESFFAENRLSHNASREGNFEVFRGEDRNITIYCGDYFAFDVEPCDALYDRGSLIALTAHLRDEYRRHTDSLLKPGASRFVITLEYDQTKVAGPPYSVDTEEIRRSWPNLNRVSARNDLDNCPPKFRDAGLSEVIEVVWASA